MKEPVDVSSDPVCPTCGGILMITGPYVALCVRPEDLDGCGLSYFRDSDGVWRYEDAGD